MFKDVRRFLGAVAFFAFVAVTEACGGDFRIADEADAGAPPTDVAGSLDATTEDAGSGDGSPLDQSHSDLSPPDQRSTDQASEDRSTPEPRPEGGPGADADATCVCCNMPCRGDADAGTADMDAAVDADAATAADAVFDADASIDTDAADIKDSGDGSADARQDHDTDTGGVADADAGCACTVEDDLGTVSFPCFCERGLCPNYDVAVNRCPDSKFWIGNRIDTYADCNLVIVSHLNEIGYSEYVFDATTHVMVGGVFADDSPGYVCGTTPVHGFRGGAYPPETCPISQSLYRCGDGGSAADEPWWSSRRESPR